MDKKAFIWLAVIVLIALAIGKLVPASGVGGAAAKTPAQTQIVEVIKFSDVDQMLQNSPKTVKQITILNGTSEIIVDREGKDPIRIKVPDQGGKELLIKKALDANVPVDTKDGTKETSGFDVIIGLLINIAPLLLIFLLFFWLMGRAAQNQQKSIQQQLSRTKDSGDKSRIDKKTFADVAGCDEAIKKLKRVVKFVTGAGTYTAMGAKTPKGVLLFGPSGTGKTLLAKAVAGETEGAFISMSGSDFVEMFVGVGASRVREMFTQARAEFVRTKKPVVLFIDEIDAVGGKRSSGYSGGGHQEREQTLNAILVEMDGMQKNSGIIVIAATNRIDILDPALIRPGRFDYKVRVDLPDIIGREKIFGIHTRGKKLHTDADLKVLALRTYGSSGADIEAYCNEAAILASDRIEEQVAKLRVEKKNEQEINALIVRAITLHEFDDAIDNVKLGEARESRFTLMTDEDKWNTTVHEVGHGWLSADRVTKVTIVPREMALGYTEALPEGERYGYDVQEAKDRIIMAMGGRVAQEVFTGTVDSGASNDFKQATNIARKMVTEWGMSPLGHISVGSDSEGAFMGQGVQGYQCGPELSAKIDKEVSAILEECYKVAREIIERDKEQILEVCLVLFKAETVLAPEWSRLLTEFPPKGETPSKRARSKPKFALPASRVVVEAPAEPAATEEVVTGGPTAVEPTAPATDPAAPAAGDGTDSAPKA